MTASLVPVLEMTAGTYSTRERPLPEGSGLENPAGWLQWWKESLADSGITGLVPMPTGHSLVALSQLTPEVISVILRRELADTNWILDELTALSGGYVLQLGSTSLPPSCCGDLSNLHEWRTAAEHTSEAWQMLWIGHPWSHVRATGSLLHLAEPSERSEPSGLADALSIERDELRAAIAVAAEELARFADVLTPLVEEVGPAVPARDVVRVLLHGHRRRAGTVT
jgi:hypothetical protein